MFGKSFDESVNAALDKVRGSFPQANVSADVKGKVVTLRGEAPSVDVKTQIMDAFNAQVATENTINQISVAHEPQKSAGMSVDKPLPTGSTIGSGPRIHEVAKGETLSAIAQKYYGKASDYHRIFDANRNILKDPDKIQVGQKLTIP